jgi:hypothetical protein
LSERRDTSRRVALYRGQDLPHQLNARPRVVIIDGLADL